MGTRVPASMRSRQQLSDLIEGRLSSADGRAELVKLMKGFVPRIREQVLQNICDFVDEDNDGLSEFKGQFQFQEGKLLPRPLIRF